MTRDEKYYLLDNGCIDTIIDAEKSPLAFAIEYKITYKDIKELFPIYKEYHMKAFGGEGLNPYRSGMFNIGRYHKDFEKKYPGTEGFRKWINL